VVEVLSVLLRAVSFVALFEAAGTVLFAVLFGRGLESSLLHIGARARRVALVGVVAVAGHGVLEPARMAGDLEGSLDVSLERLFLTSPAGAACVVRILGLTLIGAAVGRPAAPYRFAAVTGVALAVLSFLLVGHTSTSPLRWALAPLLGLHVLGVAFWLGALWPLHLLTRLEPPRVAGQILAAFSAAAAWLVPAMFLAALGIAVGLIPSLHVLVEPYGELLLTKLALFLVLLVLASLNKWRLAPAVARNDARATASLRGSIVAEYVLICGVLAVTAVLTAWFSPGP
jgi:putative copper resistance protein D